VGTPATAERRGWCLHQPQYGERNFIFRQSLKQESAANVVLLSSKNKKTRLWKSENRKKMQTFSAFMNPFTQIPARGA